MPRRTAVAPRLARELDHEPVEGGYRDVAQSGGRFAQHFDAFFEGEERILDRVLEDGDGEMFEELGATLNEIDVPVGGRVEGAGIEGFHAHGRLRRILRHGEAGTLPEPGFGTRAKETAESRWLEVDLGWRGWAVREAT